MEKKKHNEQIKLLTIHLITSYRYYAVCFFLSIKKREMQSRKTSLFLIFQLRRSDLEDYIRGREASEWQCVFFSLLLECGNVAYAQASDLFLAS